VAQRTQLIFTDNPGSVPASYTVPAGLDLVLQSIVARWNGTGAAGAFLPCLSAYSQDGKLVGRFHPNTQLAAGDTGVVTYAPFLKPPCPACPPAAMTLCGGVGVGPIAQGSVAGASFVTMTVTRDLDCYGLIVVVAAAATFGEPFPDAALRVFDISDDFNTYTLAPARAVVGSIRDEHAGVNSLVAGFSGAFLASPGYLSAGDHIYVTWQSDYPDADIFGSAAAFVITGVANTGNGITADGISGTAYGDTQTLSYTGPTYGNRTAAFGVDSGAVLVMAAAYPADTGWAPIQGAAIGQEADQISVHAGLIPNVENGAPINPGCAWTSIPQISVVNYRSIDGYI